jgi:hypothetical protein
MSATLHKLLADKEEPCLEAARQLALSDGQARQEILAGLTAKDDAYRYNCFQVVYQISQQEPQVLYAEWDKFVEMLRHSNSYHRSIGARLLANLAWVDVEGRLEGIFDDYFDLLDDEKIITARQFAQHAGRIAQAKPHLRARITERLLAVDKTHHQEGRKDLLKGDIIGALEEFFAQRSWAAGSPDQQRILDFVQQQLASSSPRTRKAAQVFLKRYGGQAGERV